MTLILIISLLSLTSALVLTPIAKTVANHFQLMDLPTERDVHRYPVPRLGGVAIFFAFNLSVSVSLLYATQDSSQFVSHPFLLWLLGGSSMVFLLGLYDDIRRLNPRVKFAVQTLAALLAYLGGVQITQLSLPGNFVYSLGFFSLPVTIFWFLLVINAINLIDGLDGLAAGVSLLASLTLAVLSVMGGHLFVAMGLAALAGSCLGFLRYNFNPASIFMGDSGSYFLGYMLASLGILGSMKSQTAVAVLIPFIVLGLPLMDTLMAPIRRFISGTELFKPDKNHIHHRLLRMGLSHRNAVLCLYGATLFLGCFALLTVHSRNEEVGLTLLLLGLTAILGVRKLGYFQALDIREVKGYLEDISDEIGLKKDRRAFLNRQLAIAEAADPMEMWKRVTDALTLLKIHDAEIRYKGVRFNAPQDGECKWCLEEIPAPDPGDDDHRVLSLDLPLGDHLLSFGTLSMKKDIRRDPINHYTLRRIEHLRRSIVSRLSHFEHQARKAN